MGSEVDYVNPGQFIFGLIFGTLTSTLLGLATTKEVTAMDRFVVSDDSYPLTSYDQVPVELVGYTTGELSSSLVLMEDSLNIGGKARVQLLTNDLATKQELNQLYSDMLADGFHTTKPVARIVGGIPSVEFTLRKGSPSWALLIPILPVAIIGGLIAFGITRIETISKALLPLMLVTVGGLVMLVALITRKQVVEPVSRVGERYLEGKSQRYLSRTIPAEKDYLAATVKETERA